MNHIKHKRLTPEQVEDIRNYLAAHKWRGRIKAIAAKHGVSVYTISNIATEKYYREKNNETK